MGARYLAFDVESGGTTTDFSLLSAYFVVLDDDLTSIYGELDLLVKPNNGHYVVTGEALGVNGINLVEHDKVAITEGKAATALYEFLKKHSVGPKLIPLGHNVAFDCEFMKEKLTKNWNEFVSYRCVDTASFVQCLKLSGHLPYELSGSLKEVAKHLGVVPNGAFHTAKTDTWVTIDVLKGLLKLIK
jgi:DNA polymerase III alpha subunit (gram-positive type)